MKPIGAFSLGVFGKAGAFAVAALLSWTSAAAGIRFEGAPAIERFPGGGVRLDLEIACRDSSGRADPAALLGARVAYAYDFDLDGVFETSEAPGPSQLFPGDCEAGALRLSRDLFPPRPGILRAELRSAADSVLDARYALAGSTGSLLALRRFCASPRNGEPEWIEVVNASDTPVSLTKARLEGRLLAGGLRPGEALTASGASDTAELRLWQPGARLFATSSWSPLRNGGDTVRLAYVVSPTLAIALDSAAYDAGAGTIAGSGAREACASAAMEESAAEAHGFALEVPPRARRGGAWDAKVRAPAASRYRLTLYDLDGIARCRFEGPGASGESGGGGATSHRVSPETCFLPPSLSMALVHLQPLRPSRAPAARARVRLSP